MAAPVWKTASGTLGTIQEQVFFELEIEATVPDGEGVEYRIIAGSLPAGLIMYEDGSIRGQPKELYYVKGVPTDVKEDVTSIFCCRATNTATRQISDRTFSITVTGEDPPTLITEAGELGKFLDGTKITIQLEAEDLDGEPITWKIIKGDLPPGLTLNETTGVISGYASQAQLNILDENVGWGSLEWDGNPWDFGSKANSISYQFIVQVTDGKTYDNAQYSMFIYSHDALTADNDYIYADLDDTVLADMDTKRNPVLLTEAADLGVYVHDNYFAYRFVGKDFDGDNISYSLLIADDIGFDNEDDGFDSGFFDEGDLELPPGLVLNTETGWMYGQIPRQVASQTEYQFAVRVYKTDYTDYQSELTYFTLTIINDLRFLVTWQTDEDLGTMPTGSISEKAIVAVNPLGRSLIYTLSAGKLPQGLNLLSDGLIVGRSSFELTTFDNGTLTFDKDVRRLGSTSTETTIDRDYTFTVKVTDANEELLSYKTFTIHMTPSSFGPYESLYLRAQPSIEDRELLNSITKNSDVLPAEALYRNSDPNFGLSKDLRMLLLSGITASNPEDYIIAMATNHYKKVLRLGEYKWAKALDENGNDLYDVVYLDVIDDQSIGNSISAPESIDLSGAIQHPTYIDNIDLGVDSGLSTIDGYGDLTVYPNSILNMRSVIKSKIGLAAKEPLPKWMTSKQADGRIPGWTPAVVIAYLLPGEGAKAVFNLNRLDADIKEINFETDRYIWDTNLSKNWDVDSISYNESTLTTFDVNLDPTSVVATVDFAVSVPFINIDSRTTEYLDENGGLDGIIDAYVGKRIIFAQQENFEGYEGEYDGWVRYNSLWDDSYGWSNPDSSWDDYEVIPGYFDEEQSVGNQRAAVWLVTRNDDGVIRLEVDQLIEPGDAIAVRNGATYGGYILKYGPNIIYSDNETVPRYSIFDANELDAETTFDSGDTRFIDSISVYEEPDEGDKYLAFPRRNIWA